MESRVPLPTDNIYKFYALFGLLIVVFALGSSIYITKTTNTLIFGSSVELATLQAKEVKQPGELQKVAMLEKELEIAIEDKSGLQYGCSLLIGLGVFMMIYGFWKWHREVQPVQDEITVLSAEKLRYEVQQLRQASGNNDASGA